MLYVPIRAGCFRFLRPRKRFRPRTAGDDIDETLCDEKSTSAYAVTESIENNFQRTCDMSKFMSEWFILKKEKITNFFFLGYYYSNVMFAENKEGRAKKTPRLSERGKIPFH